MPPSERAGSQSTGAVPAGASSSRTKRAFTGNEDLYAAHGVVDLPSKRSRHASDEKPVPNPYSVMPPPSQSFIQLRLQLVRFHGVYRVVRLPLTFTLANLYRLALFLFGWSGEHAHQFEVCTNVVMYKSNGRRGEIREYHMGPLPEPDRAADEATWQMWAFECRNPKSKPAMHVFPCGRRPRQGREYSPDPVFRYPEIKEDHEVTLGNVWSKRGDFNNASSGECSNTDVAIKLEYDLGTSWEVHIAIEPEMNGEYMWRQKERSNQPEIMVAKGGAPVEDAPRIIRSLEGKKKSVGQLLFNRDSFEKYLSGELGSCARAKELAVYNRAEEAARLRAKAQKREEKRKQKAKVVDEEDEASDESRDYSEDDEVTTEDTSEDSSEDSEDDSEDEEFSEEA